MLTHKGTVTLSTPRLILRRITVDDAQNMYNNWASDEKVPIYLTWDVHKSVEETRGLLEKWMPEYDNPMYYHWVIEYHGTIVGTINLHDVQDKPERCELGYCIGSKWWNSGIMTEAAGAVIRFAFKEMNANKVCAIHDTDNMASGMVMQKNGMKREGLLLEHKLRKDGTRGDFAYYAILKREWSENNVK